MPAMGVGSAYEGMGLLDGGATDSLGGWPAVEGVIARSIALFGRDGVEVDPGKSKSFQFGDGKVEPCLSAVRAAVQPLGIPSDFACHVANNETTPILVSVDSMERMGAIINYGAGTAIFEALNPNETVALYKSSGKHLWVDLFGKHPVVGPREAILERGHRSTSSAEKAPVAPSSSSDTVHFKLSEAIEDGPHFSLEDLYENNFEK